MAYVRKTRDVYVLQGDYGNGFEDIIKHDTFKKAKDDLIAYMRNERDINFCIRKKRIKI